MTRSMRLSGKSAITSAAGADERLVNELVHGLFRSALTAEYWCYYFCRPWFGFLR
jgi:hypothetical protein